MTKEEFKLMLFLLKYRLIEKSYVKTTMLSHLSNTVWLNPVFEPNDLREISSTSKLHKIISNTPADLYEAIIQLIREYEE